MKESDGIYVYEVKQLEKGGEARGCVGNHARLEITGDTSTQTNMTLSVAAKYKDWEGNYLTDESRSITIRVTGPGQPQEIVLNPVNGQAEFEFESPIAGMFKICAAAEFPCTPGELEVTVS